MPLSFSFLFFVSTFFLLYCFLPVCVFGKKAADSSPAIRSVRPLLDCEVCKTSINAFAQYIKVKAEEAPEKKETSNKKIKKSQSKFSEEQLFDWAEELCDENTKTGEWMHYNDIVSAEGNDDLSKEEFQNLVSAKSPQSSSFFVLSPRPDYGACQSKCFTLRSSCEHVHSHGMSEWVEQFYSSSSSSEDIISSACDHVCSKKNQKSAVKSLNYDEWKKITQTLKKDGWKSKTKEERDMEEMMASMEAMGMGGGMDMFSRDELEGMNLGDDEGMGAAADGFSFGDDDGSSSNDHAEEL